jgi:DNA invertase Pin-like site-specific DNA recombinase
MRARGEKHYKAVLTDMQVAIIREMINDGIRLNEIQENFGISRSVLHSISANFSWKHIAPPSRAKKGRADGRLREKETSENP